MDSEQAARKKLPMASDTLKSVAGVEGKWWVLLAVGAGTFMTALDGSVANIVLPVVSRAFKSDVATVEWVVTIYLLVVSGLLLSFGRLGDMRGHKSVYVSGFWVFVVSSALCGLAPTAIALIAFRALQALGGAMLLANSPAILTKNFPPTQRGQALGLAATMTYLGLTVGPSLGAQPGEKKFGVQEFPVVGQPYHLPMFLINGKQDGPTLVVTGGVHAAEYASIAAALDLGRSLEPGSLRGRVAVVPVLNMPGFRVRSIYVCPLDGKNLNRMFPGKADGSATEQIADWLFQNVMKQANYYVDLHGGDLIEALIPFTIYHHSGNEQVDSASLEMAKVFGIRYLVRSETQGSTYSAASQAGIPAILTEAGGQGIWRSEDVALHTDGLNRLMRHLGMLAGPTPEPVQCTLLKQFLWLRSEHEGFWYPRISVGDAVRKGQDLGCVKDFEGKVLQAVESLADGKVLFLVSSLAINPGDPLLAVGA